ncbi:hypothetical protein IE53DRAFT_158089 [Violaceomyces palustris]|uniref:Uncharacterized protein n=1 Tax=Violaceomyces palustris TaxID=1673888 RepID=A0ACD0P8S9_9BASI|nr:hypothetical protein IE53DRAFT_158089 [Violaceomyces palustris]
MQYLFDNLTFTQFIYVEDEIEIRKRAQEASSVSAAPGSAVFSALAPGGAMGTNNKTKVDPYYLISQGRLGELRPDLYDLIPEDSPYSYTGTLASYEINRLTAAFAYAPSIEIVTSQRPSLPNVGSWAGPEYGSASTSISTPPAEDVVMLKVTKVGIVSRKDDVVDGGKKSQSRKWKTCGLLLTGSQLLLFKDIVWTTALQAQIAEQLGHSQLSRSGSTSSIGAFNQQDAGIVISPRITFFRPDGVISLSNAVAVKDMTYEKYNFVFRLLVSEGRQYLVQAQNEDDMNDWIHKINFCASFRAVNIKIRGTDMTAPQTRSRSGTTNSKALSSEVEYSQRSRKNSLRSPSSAQRLSEDERRRNSLEKRSMGLPSTFHNLGEMEAPLGFEPHSPSWPAVPGLQDDPEQGDDEDEEAIESIASRRRREGEPRNSSSSDIRPRPTSRASTNAPSANSVGLLQRRLAARKALVLEKIQETSVELDRVSGELEEQMRLARHFSVLTPFQRATRERIEAAAVPLSRRIKNLRLELARVESRAKILELDLAACEKLIKEAGPPMTLSSSFIDDARRMPGSQLATPQLLELGRISRSQSGFEDLFGGSTDGYASPATTSGRTSPQNVRSLRMGSLSRASNEKLSISIAAREGNRGTPTRPDGGGPAPLGYFTGGASTSNGRVAGPASTQRYQMALNSVSEQPADESPSMPTTDFAANSSFASSKSGYEDYPTDTGLETDDLTESEADFDFGDGDGGLRRSHSGRARSPIMEDEETLDDEALADMFEPVTLPGKPFANGSPNSARSSASMDAERSTGGEIPERWDQSQLVKEGSNRVSLVFLPTQQELSEATKRLTLGRASGKAPQTSASPP